ncbi:uncharacterized protein PRCAT00000189001 [Priceomyces carsonii]|uniref:uncharacterized protein n=1 Tax=Priceomyces carsonii TaxID=28549 RepID=UPI002ED85F6C|nr:unnamed protein product [Priceomyces carsonii]
MWLLLKSTHTTLQLNNTCLIRKILKIPVKIDDLLHQVYQDPDELNEYSKVLSFEKKALYDLSLLNPNKRAFVEFKFGPNLKLFHSKKVIFTDRNNDFYEPISLAGGRFLELLEKRYKIMKNTRKEFLRNLLRLEYLGKYTLKQEAFQIFALIDLESSQRCFMRFISLINHELRKSKKYRPTFYLEADDEGVFSYENRVVTSRLAGNNKIKQIHPFYLYLGLRYVEDSNTNVNFILKVMKDLGYLSEDEDFTDALAIKSLSKKVSKYISNDVKLNEDILVRTSRPRLLPYKDTRLPPLPLLKRPLETTLILKLAFLHPYSRLVEPKYRGSLNRMAKSLDAFGDIILKRISFDFFHKILFKEVNYVSLLSDHLFLNSNSLFGRLAKIYGFDRGIKNEGFHEELIQNMNKDLLYNSSKTFDELLGDLFEKFVAIMYLDDPKACEKWLHQIFQSIYDTLIIDKYDGKQLNKAYFEYYFKSASTNKN